MKKLTIPSFFILGLLFWAGGVSALTLDVTYTGDNVVSRYSIWPNAYPWVDQPLGTNNTDWRYADSSTINVNPGESYGFVFVVENDPGPDRWNPGGFLAEINVGGTTYLTDSSWYAYTGDALGSGTLDGMATEYGANGSSSIWYDFYGGPVAGISEDAQWIWVSQNFEESPDTASFFIKIDIPVDAQVPEPGTILLLSAGLVCLAGIGRKKFNRE